MKLIRIVDILKMEGDGREITVKGWVRTKRGNKNVAFIALNDGSCVANIQIVVENLSLDDLKQSWIAKANTPCIFISAIDKVGIEKLRSDLYGMVREIHAGRYPFNNFLY